MPPIQYWHEMSDDPEDWPEHDGEESDDEEDLPVFDCGAFHDAFYADVEPGVDLCKADHVLETERLDIDWRDYNYPDPEPLEFD